MKTQVKNLYGTLKLNKRSLLCDEKATPTLIFSTSTTNTAKPYGCIGKTT
jgi:hypothetical protein